MSKKQAKKLRAANRTKTVVAASAIAALPMIGGTARAQIHPTDPKINSNGALMVKGESSIKFWEKYHKVHETYSIVGMEGNSPIFRKAGGEMFTINSMTGDMVPVDRMGYMKYGYQKMDATIKMGSAGTQKGWKFNDAYLKLNKLGTEGILISGVDGAGHIILQNGQGQQGYLDSNTGDFGVIQGG